MFVNVFSEVRSLLYSYVAFEPMLKNLVENVLFLGDRIGSVDRASVSKAARRCRRKEEGSNPADDLFIFRLYSVSSPT